MDAVRRFVGWSHGSFGEFSVRACVRVLGRVAHPFVDISRLLKGMCGIWHVPGQFIREGWFEEGFEVERVGGVFESSEAQNSRAQDPRTG